MVELTFLVFTELTSRPNQTIRGCLPTPNHPHPPPLKAYTVRDNANNNIEKLQDILISDRLNKIIISTTLRKPHEIQLPPFFKASTLWADAFYKSKCPSVCLSVRPCVCSLLRYRLNVFLPPHFPKSDVQYFQGFRILGEK